MTNDGFGERKSQSFLYENVYKIHLFREFTRCYHDGKASDRTLVAMDFAMLGNGEDTEEDEVCA